MRSSMSRLWLAVAVLICLLPVMSQTARAQTIPGNARVQPAALAAMLHSAHPPMVLQVGFHTLFEEAHIPAAIYAGPASSPKGLQLLRQTVATLHKSTPIVIYCGCCPWTHCPNIRPAFQQLRHLGFTHVKVLYLAHNFGTDWIQAGYPVTHGDTK
jgi:thiosulfate/3-mercaptopyruvate sulfurtransferase